MVQCAAEQPADAADARCNSSGVGGCGGTSASFFPTGKSGMEGSGVCMGKVGVCDLRAHAPPAGFSLAWFLSWAGRGGIHGLGARHAGAILQRATLLGGAQTATPTSLEVGTRQVARSV